jgi:hypothetical protein
MACSAAPIEARPALSEEPLMLTAATEEWPEALVAIAGFALVASVVMVASGGFSLLGDSA